MRLAVYVLLAAACGQPSAAHNGMDGGTSQPNDAIIAADAWIDGPPTDASIDAAPDAPPDAAMPLLVVNTDAIDFGAVKIGLQATYSLTIQNQGTSAVGIGFAITGDRAISADSGGCYIQPMQMCTKTIRFLTYAVGESTATITLTSGAWQHVVSVRGESATALHLSKWGGGGMTAPNLNCPLGCDTTFAKDIVVTAVPTSGNQFVTWSDPSCGTQPTCTLHQEAMGRFVRAYFAPMSSTTLSIAITGGSVKVENAQFGLNEIATCCGPCDVPIPVGVPIKVTAKSLGEIVGITGACTGARSCSFTSAGSTSINVTIQTDPKELWVRELETPTVLSADYDSQGNLLVVTDGYSPASGSGTSGDVIKLDPTGKTIWAHPNRPGTELHVGAGDWVFVRTPSPNGDTAWVLDPNGYQLGANSWSSVEPSTYRFPYYTRRFDITTADQRVMVGDPTIGATNVRSSLSMWTTVINAASMNVLRATTTKIYAGISNSSGGFDVAVLDHTGAILAPITDAAPHPGMFDLLPGGDIVTASATTSEIAIRRKSGSTTTFTRTLAVQDSYVRNVAATSASNDQVFWIGPGQSPALVAPNGYYAELLSSTGTAIWSLTRLIPAEVYDLASDATDVAIVGAYTGAANGGGGATANGVVFGEGFVQTFRP